MSFRALLPILFLLLSTGCRGVPELRDDFDAKLTYQQIANILPDVSLGVAEPPGVVRLTRSDKIPARTPSEQLVVFANEREFMIRTNTLVPRRFAIPYEAIEDLDFVYKTFPNLLYCVAIPFIQAWKARLIIDTKYVPKLRETIISDIRALRAIAKEISLPAPFYYAEELERRLRQTEAEWGPNRIELVIGRTIFCPPWFPYPGSTRGVAERFLWAREQALSKKPASKEK